MVVLGELYLEHGGLAVIAAAAPPPSTSVRGYVFTLVTAAVVLVTAAVTLVPDTLSPNWFGAFLLATAVTEMPLVMRRIGRQRWGWGLSEAIVAVGMFVLSPGWLMLASGGGMYLGRWGRREPLKQVFNAAQHALAAGGASMVAWLVAPDGLHLGAAAIGMAFYFLVNNTLVGVAIARSSGQPLHAVLRQNVLILMVGWAANTSLGLAAVRFLDEPWQMALLVFPLIPAHAAYYSQVQRAEEERALRLLFERVSLAEADGHAVISSILHAALEAFEATRAQVVAARPDGSVRWQAWRHRDDVAVMIDELSTTLLLERMRGVGVKRLRRPFGDMPRALIAPLECLDPEEHVLLVVVEDERPVGFSRSDERIVSSFATCASERLRLAQAFENRGDRSSGERPRHLDTDAHVRDLQLR